MIAMGYTESYVAFLDILGFKNIINNYSFNEILMVFQKIKQAKNDVRWAIYRACDEDDLSLLNYNDALAESKITIMSDSIIVSTPCKYRESLSATIDICWFIQYLLYEFEEPVLLRGAISKGTMYQNEEITFGRGMVDAYLMQENYSVYPRIILRKELLDDFEDISLKWDNKSKLVLAEDGYFYIDCLYEFLDVPDVVFAQENADRICNYIDNTIQDNFYNERIVEKMTWMKNEYKRCIDIINKKTV